MSAHVVFAGHAHPSWEAFGVLEWTATVAAALFVMWTIWKAVQYTLHPGESGLDHYKRLIFDPQPPEPVSSPGDATPPDAKDSPDAPGA